MIVKICSGTFHPLGQTFKPSKNMEKYMSDYMFIMINTLMLFILHLTTNYLSDTRHEPLVTLRVRHSCSCTFSWSRSLKFRIQSNLYKI